MAPLTPPVAVRWKGRQADEGLELPPWVAAVAPALQTAYRATYEAVLAATDNPEAAARAAAAAVRDGEPREARDPVGALMRQYECNAGAARVMIFPRGTFRHPEYGRLEFDDAFFEEVKDNYDQRALGHTEPFFDVDHTHGEAAGWIKGLSVEPAGLFATVEGTPKGTELLAAKAYRYFSPWWGPYKDPASGKTFDRVLRGGALTNVPFLKVLPPIECFEPGDTAGLRRARGSGCVFMLSELRCAEGPEQRASQVRAAFTAQFTSAPMPGPAVVEVLDDSVIVMDDSPQGLAYFRVPWAEDEAGAIAFDLAAKQAVEQRWVPVEDSPEDDDTPGDEDRLEEDEQLTELSATRAGVGAKVIALVRRARNRRLCQALSEHMDRASHTRRACAGTGGPR